MIPKSFVQFYLVPAIILVVIIVLVLIIPLGKKKVDTTAPIPTAEEGIPTIFPPQKTTSPTLIPVRDFTGAEAIQELPTDIKTLGEQKTALRRLTPLTLPFGTIDFDYENDMFRLKLSDPIEENKAQFNIWRNQNYPALLDSKFVIN